MTSAKSLLLHYVLYLGIGMQTFGDHYLAYSLILGQTRKVDHDHEEEKDGIHALISGYSEYVP